MSNGKVYELVVRTRVGEEFVIARGAADTLDGIELPNFVVKYWLNRMPEESKFCDCWRDEDDMVDHSDSRGYCEVCGRRMRI